MSLLPAAATDRRFLLAVTVALVLATSLPYLGARLATPSGMVSSGVYYQNSADWNVYYSYIEQARQGHAVMVNAFTTDDASRVYLLPIFTAAGFLSRLTGMTAVWTYHIVRLLLLPLLVVLAAAVARRFGSAGAWRWSVMLLLFAGGVGRGGEWPDLVPFLGYLFSPHYVFAWILFLCLFLVVPGAADGRIASCALLALAGTLLLLTNPFAAAIGLGTVTISFFLLRAWKSALTTWLLLLPIILYQSLLVGAHQTAQVVVHHNARLNAPLGLTLLGLGATTALSMFSIRRWRSMSTTVIVLTVLSLAVLLFPVQFQLRLLFGLPLAFALFAGQTLRQASDWLRRRGFQAAAHGLVGLVVFLLMGWAAVAMAAKTIVTAPQYAMTPQLAEVVRWVGAHMPPDGRVLSSQGLGNLIAGQTGRTVYVGHGMQTPSAEQKDQFVRSMLAGQVPASAVKRLLQEQRITDVVALASSPGLQHPADLGLQLAFTNGDYAVYSVVDVHP